MDLKLPMENIWPWPEVFRTGKPSLIEDIRTQASFDLRDRLLPLGIVTVLLVPMSIAGQLEGAIGLRFTEKRVFREDEMELAQALAIQVMLAMQLASLYAQSRESAVIAERNRLARDIHDTLAQGFTGVIVQLEAAADASSRGMDKESEKHRDRASELARESLDEARVSLRALRPTILEKNELCGALHGLFTKMTKSISVQAEFHCHGKKRKLPARWDEHLLRIAQESLTNSSRHSNAKHFLGDLYYDAAEIRLELRDDGAGFDVASRHDGFGLLGIRERVDEMGGTLLITSTSTGTTTSVHVPSAS
jgi:signal transduction histidine kinase